MLPPTCTSTALIFFVAIQFPHIVTARRSFIGQILNLRYRLAEKLLVSVEN